MRILRAALAVLVIVQGVMVYNAASILFGVVFLGMAVFNLGCCGVGGCGIDTDTNDRSNTEAVVFEEVKSETPRGKHS